MRNITLVMLSATFQWAWAISGARAETLRIPVYQTASAFNQSKDKANRLLLKFDLPSELNDARIDRVELRIQFDTAMFTNDVMLIRVFPLLSEWNHAAAGVVDVPLDEFDSTGCVWVAQRDSKVPATIDIEPIVLDWMSGRYENKGILIEPLVDPEESLAMKDLSSQWSAAKAEVELTYRSRNTDLPRESGK